MEKLSEPSRMRLTDTLRQGIREVMEIEDRRDFGETVRHVLRVGLDVKLGGRGKGLDVGVCEQACLGRAKPLTRVPYAGQERRKA